MPRSRISDFEFQAKRIFLSIQRPHANRQHLEGIEHRHRYSVSTLIGEASPDSSPQPLSLLAEVNRFNSDKLDQSRGRFRN
jgi:hypothetical protein